MKLIELITYVHKTIDLINHSTRFLFLTLSLTQTNKIITQKRKPSLEGKTNLDSPSINKEPTPLKDVGEVGPPQIVDMYDCYSVAEGWKIYF